jgi:probable HAF family extracellular repeat protein
MLLRYRPLGTLGGISFGDAINDAGQVVGSLYYFPADSSHAFLYSNGQMMDLNDLIDSKLGITLFGSNGINNKGQIVAGGPSQLGFHGTYSSRARAEHTGPVRGGAVGIGRVELPTPTRITRCCGSNERYSLFRTTSRKARFSTYNLHSRSVPVNQPSDPIPSPSRALMARTSGVPDWLRRARKDGTHTHQVLESVGRVDQGDL